MIKQFLKFSIVGIINTGLDLVFFNFLILATGIYKGGWLGVLNFIAFSLATVNSYFLNKFWVFKKKELSSFSNFFLISLISCVINTSIVYSVATFVSPFFGVSQLLWINIAKLLAIFISLFCNFFGYKFWVFKK
ncbi:hypothetical protein CVV26_02660 [Candidatus Kuenenbacteria bacterium HGW-Kuenenbacteria-1]|uniref:GtrA/DPMS transmembrane domain-containing protein n=1 Tax=Candidatus Kuenenbacteria bacterium HGW-Kuenenbacteria-1 TaxID=2013812 RepID=A0A2N1UN14_9BACT|nr:MAG: hypothetical protein CVV26_02660 [Candidatus Kuenenbacteria bacterium HGW-Kuenenbacteria-1]